MREWLDAVGAFLTPSEASRPAVFKNLDGAFDPEEIFFVGTQAARLGMAEATTIQGRAVDAGYAAAESLARHPWRSLPMNVTRAALPVDFDVVFARLLVEAWLAFSQRTG